MLLNSHKHNKKNALMHNDSLMSLMKLNDLQQQPFQGEEEVEEGEESKSGKYGMYIGFSYKDPVTLQKYHLKKLRADMLLPEIEKMKSRSRSKYQKENIEKKYSNHTYQHKNSQPQHKYSHSEMTSVHQKQHHEPKEKSLTDTTANRANRSDLLSPAEKKSFHHNHEQSQQYCSPNHYKSISTNINANNKFLPLNNEPKFKLALSPFSMFEPSEMASHQEHEHVVSREELAHFLNELEMLNEIKTQRNYILAGHDKAQLTEDRKNNIAMHVGEAQFNNIKIGVIGEGSLSSSPSASTSKKSSYNCIPSHSRARTPVEAEENNSLTSFSLLSPSSSKLEPLPISDNNYSRILNLDSLSRLSLKEKSQSQSPSSASASGVTTDRLKEKVKAEVKKINTEVFREYLYENKPYRKIFGELNDVVNTGPMNAKKIRQIKEKLHMFNYESEADQKSNNISLSAQKSPQTQRYEDQLNTYFEQAGKDLDQEIYLKVRHDSDFEWEHDFKKRVKRPR